MAFVDHTADFTATVAHLVGGVWVMDTSYPGDTFTVLGGWAAGYRPTSITLTTITATTQPFSNFSIYDSAGNKIGGDTVLFSTYPSGTTDTTFPLTFVGFDIAYVWWLSYCYRPLSVKFGFIEPDTGCTCDTTAFTITEVGSLQSTAGQIRICDNGLQAYMVDGSHRYSYNIASHTLTTIADTDGAFEGGGQCDAIDNFIIYNRPNTNQWAATDPLSTATNGLSFSSKDSTSDNIVGLIADHRQVYLIGEKTTEIWVDVGSFPFPFSRFQGAIIQHGCAAKSTITRFGESVAWLAKDARGSVVVVMLNGYQLQRLSTHAVENDIVGGVYDDAFAFSYRSRGHEFLMLTFPTQDKTWCYDLASGIWHKRAYRDEVTGELHRHVANCHASFKGLNLVGDYRNGIIYSFEDDVFTDNGVTILRLRRTPHVVNGLNRIFYDSLQIQFQPGIGPIDCCVDSETGQGSTPQARLRWSDDGGFTWSNEYLLDIGERGEFKNRAIKRKMGFSRNRIFEVSVSDPVFAVIISAEIYVQTGNN